MTKLDIYLNFMGNTEEAFNFYRTVFSGKFSNLTRFKDIKDLPNKYKMSKKDMNKIMHVYLPIGDASTLMGTDMLEYLGHKLELGNNFSISVDVKSKFEADKLFNKLSKGGKVDMPPKLEFWGAYFGMTKDKFGIRWMVSYVPPKEK